MSDVPTEAVYAMDAALQKHTVYLGRVTIAELLAAVAPLIAAQERERCARVAHQHGYDLANLDERNGAFSAAAAIRALGDGELPKNDSR